MRDVIRKSNVEKMFREVNLEMHRRGYHWEIDMETWSASDGSGTAYQLRHSVHNTYLSSILTGREMYKTLHTLLKMIPALGDQTQPRGL